MTQDDNKHVQDQERPTSLFYGAGLESAWRIANCDLAISCLAAAKQVVEKADVLALKNELGNRRRRLGIARLRVGCGVPRKKKMAVRVGPSECINQIEQMLYLITEIVAVAPPLGAVSIRGSLRDVKVAFQLPHKGL